MSHIKHFIKIELLSPSEQNQSDEKKANLYPFRSIRATVYDADNYCPFCGNEIDRLFYCKCREFKRRFRRLQESFGDKEHYPRLHYITFRDKYKCEQPVESLEIKELSEDEIKKLDPEIWEDAREDDEYLFDVDNATVEDNNISFLYQDTRTQKVYRCTMKDVGFTGFTIKLGMFLRTSTGCWEDIETFENWDKICEALQSVWFETFYENALI